MTKSKAEILKEKKQNLISRSKELDHYSIGQQALSEFNELKAQQPLKHQAFRLLPQDIDYIKDITYTLKWNLDPNMTQSSTLHIMIEFFKAALGDDFETRSKEEKVKEQRRAQPRRQQYQPSSTISTPNSEVPDEDDGL